MYAQGYFAYDSKKSGGITVSHLRFGKTPIQIPYLIDYADFIACHNPSLRHHVTTWSAAHQGRRRLPAQQPLDGRGDGRAAARFHEAAPIAKKHARFYTIDAIKLAREVGMGGRINTIMQAAFFKLADVIPYDQADDYMKAYAKKTYGKKGDDVVKKNWDAIDIAIAGLNEVKVSRRMGRRHHRRRARARCEATEYFDNFVEPDPGAGRRQAARFHVRSSSGRVPVGTTKYEKRGIAVMVPEWDVDQVHPVRPAALWFARMPASVLTC